MQVKNVGTTNYQKQPNFTSVQLFVGNKFSNVSLSGVRGLLQEIGSKQDPKKVLSAFKNLVVLDKACNQGRAQEFILGIRGIGKNGVKLIGGMGGPDPNCPRFAIELSPNKSLGRKLADAYCTMIAKYAKIENDGAQNVVI